MGFFTKISDLLSSTQRPTEGTPVQVVSILREKLLGLNRDSAPYHVALGDAERVDLIVGWKVDKPDWRKMFEVPDVQKVFRIFLKFDESHHEVRAVDREYAIRWSVDGASLSVSAEAFRGQKTEISFGGPALYTETLPDGRALEYRFMSKELKKPLQDVVTGCGWTYKGVAFEKL